MQIHRQCLVSVKKNIVWSGMNNLHLDCNAASFFIVWEHGAIEYNLKKKSSTLKHLLDISGCQMSAGCCVFLGITGTNKDNVAVFPVQLLQRLTADNIPCWSFAICCSVTNR